MQNLIEIEKAGYSHRIKYICDTESGFGVVTRQVYSYFKNGELVWSEEFPAGVSFDEMARAFMESGLYQRAMPKLKKRTP